jgi:hydrogenase maturation factor HypF (carbamoyltransferase family)
LDVIKLFESSGFSLGKTEITQLQVVAKFRKLMKERFLSIIDTVKEKENSLVSRECGNLLDISSEVLQILHNEGALVIFNG